MKHLLLLITSSIITILVSSCKKPDSAIEQTIHFSNSLSTEFKSLYDAPIPPFKKKPGIERTGNIGATKNLTYLLTNFPEDRMEEVETFIRQKMKQDSIHSVTVTYMIPDPEWKEINVIKGYGSYKYSSDGHTEHSTTKDPLQAVPSPTLNGKTIK